MRRLLILILGTVPVAGCFDDTGMGDSGTTGGTDELCMEYCGRVVDNCKGTNVQYEGQTACMDLCGYMQGGSISDQAEHTIQCRNHWAVEASENPDMFCEEAGPLGGNVCGSPCEVFCDLNLKVCAGQTAVFANRTECIAECQKFPNDVPYSSQVQSGDSLACRMYHLNVAAGGPAAAQIHCPHTGPVEPADGDLPCNPEVGGTGGTTGTGGSVGTVSGSDTGTGTGP